MLWIEKSNMFLIASGSSSGYFVIALLILGKICCICHTNAYFSLCVVAFHYNFNIEEELRQSNLCLNNILERLLWSKDIH
jgi:hypothetical protein